jgi:uncharacterized protein
VRPLKIRSRSGKPDSTAAARMSGSGAGRKTASVINEGFKEQFESFESRNYYEKLGELAQNIAKQGQKLSSKADISELSVYRKLIAEFVDSFVNSSHRFSKQSFLDRRGRHRAYAVIKRINTELDGLANDVLNTARDNIRMLKRIEDIKGLVLDLIM